MKTNADTGGGTRRVDAPQAEAQQRPLEDLTAQKRVNLSGHIPTLDGVRGLALLMVVVYHCTLPDFLPGNAQSGSVDWFYHVFASVGWMGVDLFFVLSGFLITGILIDARERPKFFRNFYMRRVLRIFPLYYAMLLVALLVMPVLLGLVGYPSELIGQHFHASWETAAWYFTYLSNFYSASAGAVGGPEGEANRALQVMWSLAIEEQFYMVWPLVVFLVPPRWLGRVCVFLIVAGLGSRALLLTSGLGLAWFGEEAVSTAVYVLPFCRMDALAMGALVAVVARQQGGMEQLWRAGWVALAIGGAWVVFMLTQYSSDPAISGTSSRAWLVQLPGYTLIALGFAGFLIVCANVRRGPVQRLLAKPPLTSVGRVSYAMYLFHLPVIIMLHEIGLSPSALPFAEVAGMTLPALVLFTLAAVLVTFALAWVSWHGFEKHWLALKRYFPSGQQRAR